MQRKSMTWMNQGLVVKALSQSCWADAQFVFVWSLNESLRRFNRWVNVSVRLGRVLVALVREIKQPFVPAHTHKHTKIASLWSWKNLVRTMWWSWSNDLIKLRCSNDFSPWSDKNTHWKEFIWGTEKVHKKWVMALYHKLRPRTVCHCAVMVQDCP